MNKRIYIILLAALVFFNIGCRKFIEIAPPITSVSSGSVYKQDGMAISVLTGLYIKLSKDGASTGNTPRTVALSTGLMGDELTLWYLSQPDFLRYYHNKLTAAQSPGFWTDIYKDIEVVNLALEGITQSNSLTSVVKERLTGEAKFMRAFYFFHLVNLYGDVPLPITSDYTSNNTLGRAPVEDVYRQIIKDLQEAKSLLSEDFMDVTLLKSTTDRVRPNKWCAAALLARVYLYNGQYDLAEKEAGEVIAQTSRFHLTDLSQTFLINNDEAIWQLQTVGNGTFSNPEEGALYVLPSTGPSSIQHLFVLSPFVVQSFEEGDQRKAMWTGNVAANNTTYYYANKYKVAWGVEQPPTEYQTVFRLAEQYLIRAEARARQDNLDGAAADLLEVRKRAGLGAVAISDKQAMLDTILHERQVELFLEWGHRWFDLQRFGKMDEVMNVVAPIKGTTWDHHFALMPIPQTSLNANRNLIGKQNPGYN